MAEPGPLDQVFVQVVPVEPGREIGWGSAQVAGLADVREAVAAGAHAVARLVAHLTGRGAGRTGLPMTAEQIRAVQQAAATPAQRLAIALATVHAARPGAIRELTLEDIDPPSWRISIAGHRQPARPDHAQNRPGHRTGLRQLPRRLPRQAPARHLPRTHPARSHPARSPGHRRRPAPPCPGVQHR